MKVEETLDKEMQDKYVVTKPVTFGNELLAPTES